MSPRSGEGPAGERDARVYFQDVLESIAAIAGMRDVLIREYFGVSMKRVLRAVSEDLPVLKSGVASLEIAPSMVCSEIQCLRAEVERLRAENRALKERLERPEVRPVTATSTISPRPAPGHAHEPDVAASVHAGSPPEEKVRLFMQLFRGREDVCAARWAGKDGRSGYQCRT